MQHSWKQPAPRASGLATILGSEPCPEVRCLKSFSKATHGGAHSVLTVIKMTVHGCSWPFLLQDVSAIPHPPVSVFCRPVKETSTACFHNVLEEFPYILVRSPYTGEQYQLWLGKPTRYRSRLIRMNGIHSLVPDDKLTLDYEVCRPSLYRTEIPDSLWNAGHHCLSLMAGWLAGCLAGWLVVATTSVVHVQQTLLMVNGEKPMEESKTERQPYPKYEALYKYKNHLQCPISA
jgi:hypothetical protein